MSDSEVREITMVDGEDAGQVLRVLRPCEDPAPGTVDPVKAADLLARGWATEGGEAPGAKKPPPLPPAMQPDMTELPVAAEEETDV